MHRDYGMLVMSGPGIRPGAEIEGAVIQDIAPTVLHVMGLPVPSDMDGHVLEDAFAEGFMDAYPLQVAESSGDDRMSDEAGYTEEGEKEILERLRGLGYMG
jgi:arylsulfatase A-like enzyme